MVTAFGCAILLCLGGAGTADTAKIPLLSAWAVAAKNEGRETKTFDAKLDRVRSALDPLPFDTYACLNDFSGSVALGQEVEIPVSGRHTLFLKPKERLADGRLLLEFRVEMPSRELRGKPVKGLKAEVKLIPGELLNVRGFHLESGEELILVLRVDFPPPRS